MIINIFIFAAVENRYKPNAPLAIPTPQVSMLSFLEKDHSLFVSLANSKLSEVLKSVSTVLHSASLLNISFHN